MPTPIYTFAPNETHMFPGGNSCVIMAADYAELTVEFLRNNSPISSSTNVGAGFKNYFDVPFDAIRVTAGAHANVVQIGFDYGKLDYSAFANVNVTGGSVQPIGGVLNAALAPMVTPARNSANGADFSGGVNIAATAGSYSLVQLFNPAGSGKTLAVRSVDCASTVNAILLGTIYNVALSTAAGSPLNKLAGGAASVALLKYQYPVTTSGFGSVALNNMPVLASVKTSLLNASPIILPAGYGLVMINLTVNSDLYANFEWDEY